MLDYEVTVIDDRAEFVDKARVAGASRAICRPLDEALDILATLRIIPAEAIENAAE